MTGQTKTTSILDPLSFLSDLRKVLSNPKGRLVLIQHSLKLIGKQLNVTLVGFHSFRGKGGVSIPRCLKSLDAYCREL